MIDNDIDRFLSALDEQDRQYCKRCAESWPKPAAYYLSAPDRPGLWWARKESGLTPDGEWAHFQVDGWAIVEVRVSGDLDPHAWLGQLIGRVLDRQPSFGARLSDEHGFAPMAKFAPAQWTPVSPPQPVAVDCDCPPGTPASAPRTPSTETPAGGTTAGDSSPTKGPP